jgi:hypothetical protein
VDDTNWAASIIRMGHRESEDADRLAMKLIQIGIRVDLKAGAWSTMRIAGETHEVVKAVAHLQATKLARFVSSDHDRVANRTEAMVELNQPYRVATA